MLDKQIALFIYGLVGLWLTTVLPIQKRKILFDDQKIKINMIDYEPLWLIVSIYLLLGIFFTSLLNKVPWIYLATGAFFSCILGFITSKEKLITAASIYFGMLIVTVMPWWLRPDGWNLSIGGMHSIIAITTLSLIYWLFSKETKKTTDVKGLLKDLNFYIYIIFSAAVAFLVLFVGLALAIADGTTWHHWSAFIGPAKLMAAGALPLLDIPIQYGLGSALILNLGCKFDCWTSMYWLSSLTTIALTYLVAYIALKLSGKSSPLHTGLILAIVTASCLFWTSYPPNVSGALATPSTSGIRFLPGLIVLAWVLSISRQNKLSIKTEACGHALWMLCIIWSPEAGIHSTLIWAPYFIWTRTLRNEKVFLNNLIYSILTLIIVFVVVLGILKLIYFKIYGDWPIFAEYLTYILLPPGAMLINLNGTIWFALICLVCWYLGLFVCKNRNINSKEYRACWLVALLCIGNFTYYLGRSHDNNILNLMPYFALLLIAMRSVTGNNSMKVLVITLLSAILGFTTIFGWSTWIVAYKNVNVSQVTIKNLVESFDRETNKTFDYRMNEVNPKLHPTDAAAALNFIHDNFQESVVVLDQYLILNSGEKYDYWSAMQVPTNFILLPTKLRQEYLSRVAKRLNKPGWVIYRTGYEEYIKDYDSVYDRVEKITIGSYTAIRYIPK